MTAKKNIKREIEAQKEVVSRLKKEVFGADKTNSSKYIRQFHSEFERYREICPVSRLIETALESDIVFFGDYHPLRASQDWALLLMRELTARGAKLVLALEMLYEFQQESLDRWMKGRYSEEEFLKVIDYESEWGFEWASYRRFFESARDPFVPIFGIDYEPRDQLKYIRRRDEMMARKIASIRNFFPDHIILVIVGESHLASNHLPSRVRKTCGETVRGTTIVQNIDQLYWKLLLSGREEAGSVIIDRDRFCIFTASPMIKYQAYRDMIELWSQHSISESVLSSMEEIVDNIFMILMGGEKPLDVTVNGDWKEPLESVFPEVQRRRTYKSFFTMLRAQKVSDEGLLVLKENLRRSGIYYMPAINGFLLLRFDQALAAREAARFIVYAMRDEVGQANSIRRSEEDRFYAFIFEEALTWVGAKLVNPLVDPADTGDLSGRIGRGGRVTSPVEGYTLQETRETARFLKYHLKREREGKGSMRRTALLDEIYRLEIRKRLLIIRTLGKMLGFVLFEGFHQGLLSREELKSLFAQRFDIPGSGKRLYVEWIGRLGGLERNL